MCDIVRFSEARADKSRWAVTTDIKLDDAEGSLVAFPYPMSGIRGEIRVMDDHLEIIDARMQRANATLNVSGRVDWRNPGESDDPRAPIAKSGSSLRPNLKIAAKNVPIDNDLLAALPEKEREWLSRMGAAGNFDLEGMLTRKTRTEKGELDFAFDVTLHQCAMALGKVACKATLSAIRARNRYGATLSILAEERT